MAAKESEATRYLRSTISNLAFLGLIAYGMHLKAFSEASLVVIVQLFLTFYFGARAVQNHIETRVDQAVEKASMPRMQAVRPERDSEPPSDDGAPPVDDVYRKVTRDVRQQTPGALPVPRRDDVPTRPGEQPRGRYRRLLLHWGTPALAGLAGLFLYTLLSIAAATVSVAAGLGNGGFYP